MARGRPAVRHFISIEAVVSAESEACAAPLTTKRRARQRLEGGGDRTVGIVIMRPGETAAQRQDAVRHREGFVGAEAEFAAGIGDALRAIVQREGAAAAKNALGIGRQIERRELGGCIGRDAEPPIHGVTKR